MDSIDYAIQLEKEFGVDQGDAIKMMDVETDDMRNDPFYPKRKLNYQEALDLAYEHLKDWLATGHEYAIRLDWNDIAQFAASHRRACVWAVLTCKARKVVRS